ncbi:MAG: Z1 domain-containing protein [Acidimicrobiales bacterium]
MSSDGDLNQALANWRRVVQTKIDALGWNLDQALEEVPAALRAALRDAMEAEAASVRFHRPGATIRRGGPKEWFEEWDPAEGYLWRRLRSHLIDDKAWSLRDVEGLDASSDNVLKHIEDPRTDAPHSKTAFRIQGLVLGYVQSGKTANFTSLIAKAADRGYKLVIVLSGIHNSLRSQTQRRLDLELGLVADSKGVGLPDSPHVWWRITSSELNGDFKPGTDAGPLQQGSRGIMVVKKNATVLRRLVRWLDGRVPADLPVLIIDDEADQASINTNPPIEEVDLGPDTGDFPAEKELDPSTINGLIRDLIDQFPRVSYVAYTATPFANVLIDPDIDSERHGSDLFPNDFMISLARPPAYVGAERIFGRPALEREDEPLAGLDVIRIVPDEELPALVPKGRAAANWEPAVTPSLELAIMDWLLATAAKVQRLGEGISSMLIHTTQKIAQQNGLAEVVEESVRDIRNAWRYDPDSVRPRFIERWNSEFRPVTVSLDADLDRPFADIEPHLNDLLRVPEAIDLLVLNSSSRDLLDYETNPITKVLLIGGNRLSRGLTLEDLTVSFYVREANNYDTLLQMGRWFGYRSSFVDLTRLWTTDELVSRFRHLALVEEDLRDQIAIYEREGLTPRDVAPRIRSHPAMLVTARNRMGSAERVRQSYAGELLQTIRFRLGNDSWLQGNLDCTRELLSSLGQPTGVSRSGDDRPAWSEVPWAYVEGFLTRFRTAQDAMSFDADTAARYVRSQAENYGELVKWTIAVRCGATVDNELGVWGLGIEGVGDVPAISRSQLKGASGSIGVLTSPARLDNLAAGDEAIDLTDGQLEAASRDVRDFPTVGHAIRAFRPPTQGLLMIFPISPYSKARVANAKNRVDLFEDPTGRPLVVGVAVSFPPSHTGATVEYVAGKQSVHSIFATDDD